MNEYMCVYSGGFKEGRPLLTKCMFKIVKILHKNALFLHKIFKLFMEPNHSPPQTPLPTLLPLLQISGSATVYLYRKNV